MEFVDKTALSMYQRMIDDGSALSLLFWGNKENIFIEDISLNAQRLSVRTTKKDKTLDCFVWRRPLYENKNWIQSEEIYTLKDGIVQGAAYAVVKDDLDKSALGICNYENGKIDGVLRYMFGDCKNIHEFSEGGFYMFANGILKHSITLCKFPINSPYGQGYFEGVKDQYDTEGNIIVREMYSVREKNKLGEFLRDRTYCTFPETFNETLLRRITQIRGKANTYHVKNYDLCEEYDIVDGVMEGILTRYNASGKVVAEEEYVHDMIVKSTEYDANTGYVLRRFMYKDGKKHGPFVDYEDFGKKRQFIEGQYENGFLEGNVFHKISKDGTPKLVKVCSYHRGDMIREMTAKVYYNGLKKE